MTMINYDIGSAVPGDIIRWSLKRSNQVHVIILLSKESKDIGYGTYYELTGINQTGSIFSTRYDPIATDWMNYELIK